MRGRTSLSCMALGMALVLGGCTSPADPDPGSEPVAVQMPGLPPPDGTTLFRIACAGCHRIEADGPHDVGPNLFGIIGQPAASRPGYSYSPALLNAGLAWDRSTLAAWVAATEILVPGTTMTYANILDGDEVARLIDHVLFAATATGAHQLQGERDED